MELGESPVALANDTSVRSIRDYLTWTAPSQGIPLSICRLPGPLAVHRSARRMGTSVSMKTTRPMDLLQLMTQRFGLGIILHLKTDQMLPCLPRCSTIPSSKSQRTPRFRAQTLLGIPRPSTGQR